MKLGFEMNWRNETYFVIIQWKVRVQSLRGKMVVKKKIAEAKINRGGVHFCSGYRMMLQDRWNDTGYTERFFLYCKLVNFMIYICEIQREFLEGP